VVAGGNSLNLTLTILFGEEPTQIFYLAARDIHLPSARRPWYQDREIQCECETARSPRASQSVKKYLATNDLICVHLRPILFG